MMREKNLLMYWADKNHNAIIICGKMESYFGSSDPSYSWVLEWLRALKRGGDIFEPCERSGMPQDPLTGLTVLNSTPLASIRQTAASANLPHPPRYRRQLY
jgi:hypothetical protein